MKNPFGQCTLLLFLLASVSHAQFGTLIHDGIERTYLLHLPPSYDSAQPHALIIAMHGGFGSASNLQRQSELSEKSDAAGFIVVYPEGVAGLLGIRTWNAGGCCGQAMSNNVDDVGFIATLLDTLSDAYNIDQTRIYATGMSNGGMMAYRLACEIPDKIAAIAPVAATMTAQACAPSRPVPLVHFHSFLDENVPYQGGVGTGVSSHHNPPLDSVFTVWSEFNDCAQVDTLQDDENLFWVEWSRCGQNSAIVWYMTRDGGHSWPGGMKTVVEGSDPPSEIINAGDLMWTFFQAHSLAEPTAIGNNEPDRAPSAIRLAQNYPNPFNPTTKIEFRLVRPGRVLLTVYDLLGKPVKRLVDRSLTAGAHVFVWDATGDSGRRMSAGVYFYRLRFGTFSQTRKLLLIK